VKVYASCSSYALGCVVGPGEAARLVNDSVADVSHAAILPAVNALRELRTFTDHLEFSFDGGATQIAKCRSRHFTRALESTCDVWVTLDDDIDTDRPTLALLLAAVAGDEPRVCFAPYYQRGMQGVVLMTFPPVMTERTVYSEPTPSQETVSGTVRNALHGGFGLVAVNRAAMQAVARDAPTFRDGPDGEHLRVAAFLETITSDGYWLGEDFAFFARARAAGVRVEALVSGRVLHAGAMLDLSTLRE
jgi:hypothetical protein